MLHDVSRADRTCHLITTCNCEWWCLSPSVGQRDRGSVEAQQEQVTGAAQGGRKCGAWREACVDRHLRETIITS